MDAASPFVRSPSSGTYARQAAAVFGPIPLMDCISLDLCRDAGVAAMRSLIRLPRSSISRDLDRT